MNNINALEAFLNLLEQNKAALSEEAYELLIDASDKMKEVFNLSAATDDHTQLRAILITLQSSVILSFNKFENEVEKISLIYYKVFPEKLPLDDIEAEISIGQRSYNATSTVVQIKSNILKAIALVNGLALVDEKINQLLNGIFFPGLSLLQQADVKEIISAWMDSSLGQNKAVVFQVLAYIIAHAGQNNMLLALEHCAEQQAVKDFIAQDRRFDRLLVESIKGTALIHAQHDGYYRQYAKMITGINASRDALRLTDVFIDINFIHQGSQRLAKAFYEVFIKATPLIINMFFHALILSRQLDYFKIPEIQENLDKETKAALDVIYKGSGPKSYVDMIGEYEKKKFNLDLKPGSFLTAPFLIYARLGLYALQDQLTWHRLMYWLGEKINVQASVRTLENKKSTSAPELVINGKPRLEVDVPGDGNCLYYATLCSALLTAFASGETAFEQMADKLLGYQPGSSEIDLLKIKIKEFKKDEIKRLFSQYIIPLRKRVVAHIKQNWQVHFQSYCIKHGLQAQVTSVEYVAAINRYLPEAKGGSSESVSAVESWLKKVGLEIAEVQGKTVPYVKANETLRPHVVLESTDLHIASVQEFNDYLVKQEMDGTWAGEYEIHALQEMLQVGIDVYANGTAQTTVMRSPRQDNRREQIQLTYIDPGHYKFLITPEHLPGSESEIRDATFEKTQSRMIEQKFVDEIEAYRPLLAPLIECLKNLYLFYDTQHHRVSYQKLYELIVEKLIDAVKLSQGKSLKVTLQLLESLVNGILQIYPDQLDLILAANKPVGDFANGFESIKDAFINSMRGGDPDQWTPRTLSDRIFFLYCYIKYPVDEFYKWFKDANPGHAHYIKQQRDGLEQFKRALPGITDLPGLGFKVIQNNQLAALACVLKPPASERPEGMPEVIFARVDTGQGKSLIIALTALYYALSGMKVLVATCYNHLAIRDFERFQELFRKRNIESQVIKDSTDLANATAKITYTELKTYFDALSKQVQRRIDNENKGEPDFDFSTADVIIMDEADSLNEDAPDFRPFVADIARYFGLPTVQQQHFDSDSTFRTLLNENQACNVFLARLEQHGLLHLYRTWFNSIKSQMSAPPKNKQDALGKTHNYIGGIGHELLVNKKLYSHLFTLAPLAFLSSPQLKKIIGFSGTITQEAVNGRYKTLYPGALFFRIPPFYGPVGDTKNIRRTESLGLTISQWSESIIRDIEEAHQLGRPVLVFANNEEQERLSGTDWEKLEEAIRPHLAQQSKVLHVISKEEHVDTKNLALACQSGALTLATKIVGRGADFVLQRDVIQLGGLHVLITYLPKKRNETSICYVQMLKQMIGRGGRSDQPGSHSIITHAPDTALSVGGESTISKPNYEYFYLLRHLHNYIIGQPNNAELWKYWLLLNLFTDDSTKITSTTSDLSTATPEEKAEFIIRNVFQENRQLTQILQDETTNPIAGPEETGSSTSTPPDEVSVPVNTPPVPQQRSAWCTAKSFHDYAKSLSLAEWYQVFILSCISGIAGAILGEMAGDFYQKSKVSVYTSTDDIIMRAAAGAGGVFLAILVAKRFISSYGKVHAMERMHPNTLLENLRSLTTSEGWRVLVFMGAAALFGSLLCEVIVDSAKKSTFLSSPFSRQAIIPQSAAAAGGIIAGSGMLFSSISCFGKRHPAPTLQDGERDFSRI